MLSILIPIYNFNVEAFVGDLSRLSERLSVPCEIICLDDKSNASFNQIHESLNDLPNVRFQVSEVNLGRSAVRNKLVSMAQYDHLLILDCDGKVLSDDYLQKYVDASTDYDVIYGGREYQAEAPRQIDLMFHWYCGKVREAVMVEKREEDPFKSFMTNNFLIRREVYEKIKMDEGVQGYGHEDTLFAIELRKAGFSVKHIDNPLEHIGLEPFDVFIAKSENGVRNLARLIRDDRVGDSIKLVRFYHKLSRWGLMPLVSALVGMNQHRIYRSLKSTAPNLMWFDFWKLRKLHIYMQTTAE